MAATTMCPNFGGFRLSPPKVVLKLLLAEATIQATKKAANVNISWDISLDFLVFSVHHFKKWANPIKGVPLLLIYMK